MRPEMMVRAERVTEILIAKGLDPITAQNLAYRYIDSYFININEREELELQNIQFRIYDKIKEIEIAVKRKIAAKPMPKSSHRNVVDHSDMLVSEDVLSLAAYYVGLVNLGEE